MNLSFMKIFSIDYESLLEYADNKINDITYKIYDGNFKLYDSTMKEFLIVREKKFKHRLGMPSRHEECFLRAHALGGCSKWALETIIEDFIREGNTHIISSLYEEYYSLNSSMDSEEINNIFNLFQVQENDDIRNARDADIANNHIDEENDEDWVHFKVGDTITLKFPLINPPKVTLIDLEANTETRINADLIGQRRINNVNIEGQIRTKRFHIEPEQVESIFID